MWKDDVPKYLSLTCASTWPKFLAYENSWYLARNCTLWRGCKSPAEP